MNTRNSSKKQGWSSSGQSLIEIALILPVFLLILLGFLEWGVYLFSRITVDNASFSSARLAVTFIDWSSNRETRETQVRQEFMNKARFIPAAVLPDIESNIVIEFDSSVTNIQYITVRMNELPYKTISGFGDIFQLPANLRTEARVRYEGI